METMTEKEAFLLMEEQGWQPMPCDTPVPLYDVPASCGLPTPVGNETNDVTMLPKDIVNSMDAFVIRAKGDSMIGANIIDGDFALVDKTAQVYDSDIVVALIDGECVLKCYCTDDDGQTWLAPRNDAYDAIPVREGQDLFIFGVVTEVWRKSPRVTHRECIDVVNRTKRRARKPKEVCLSEVEAMVRAMAGSIKTGRLWYAVFRPLVDLKFYAWNAYGEFVGMVRSVVPDHEHLPSEDGLQRMATGSFTKSVGEWKESNAPVKNKRFATYKSTAKQVFRVLGVEM